MEPETLKAMQSDLLARLYEVTIDALEETFTSQEKARLLRETCNCFGFALPKNEEAAE